MTICVLPDELVDVIWVTPGTLVANEFSNGVATAVAMVSALAPGSWAEICMVGKSICGSGATGSWA
jgi:hypothetical protein